MHAAADKGLKFSSEGIAQALRAPLGVAQEGLSEEENARRQRWAALQHVCGGRRARQQHADESFASREHICPLLPLRPDAEAPIQSTDALRRADRTRKRCKRGLTARRACPVSTFHCVRLDSAKSEIGWAGDVTTRGRSHHDHAARQSTRRPRGRRRSAACRAIACDQIFPVFGLAELVVRALQFDAVLHLPAGPICHSPVATPASIRCGPGSPG